MTDYVGAQCRDTTVTDSDQRWLCDDVQLPACLREALRSPVSVTTAASTPRPRSGRPA
jgi:hypothetical protein